VILYDDLPKEKLIELLTERAHEQNDGIRITFQGKTAPWHITAKVKPRCQKIIDALCVGPEDAQSKNLIVEGENLQAMVSLYKYRGQVDLILTDPPYNTGNDFRYNDRWDDDPNDPDLGPIVPADDDARHTKWLRFMAPRLWMMKEMLKPGGVLAICIDHRELFRLGMLLDEIFREHNRIGVINWQKTYSPKNDKSNLSTATEYVLIYAKNIDQVETTLLARTEAMNARYKNADGDPDGDWAPKDIVAKEPRKNTVFAIQSPFTGFLHYPEGEYRFTGDVPEPSKHWRGIGKQDIRKSLEHWGVAFEERDLGDGRGRALVIAGSKTTLRGYCPDDDPVVKHAREKAFVKRGEGCWPLFYFRDNQQGEEALGRPRIKVYLNKVKRGHVPVTYWAVDDYDTPFFIESQSWNHEESGHSQSGIDELGAIIGKGHNFQTVKPLKLFTKIIQLWCQPDGLVMDPFAGSGTTAHSVLLTNATTDSDRKFVLIEQGRAEKGDAYAKTLTAERVRRAITGQWAKGPMEVLDGGYRFTQLMQKVDAEAVMALQRVEMLDLLLTSYWDQANRAASYLERLPAGSHRYLVAKNKDDEGYYLVWQGRDKPSELDRETFKAIVKEARDTNLKPRYHVYAHLWTYQGPSIEFYRIPDRILDHLGFNEMFDAYNNSDEREMAPCN